jgi:glyoxylase-like metal-dependent hydrolase (beta-lactamase superfamily II)
MSIRKHYEYEEVKGIKVGRVNQGINTQFIVYRLGDTLIDAGPSNQWNYLQEFLTQGPVRQLLLTHHHEDHSGNAQRIAEMFSILPKAPKLGQEKLANGYKTPLLQKMVWGSPLPVKTEALSTQESLSDGSKVIPVHTPGHAKDLTVFFLPEQKYLFSGDLYISRKLKMLRIDENLQQLVESLKKVLKLDFQTVFCPHAGVIEDGKDALQDKLDYILELCKSAQDMKEKGADIETITSVLLGKEMLTSRLTRGNFCKRNLIEQAVLIDLVSC